MREYVRETKREKARERERVRERELQVTLAPKTLDPEPFSRHHLDGIAVNPEP